MGTLRNIFALFFLCGIAEATLLLDAPITDIRVTNNVSVGAVTVSNNIPVTVSSGAVAIAGGTFTGSVFNPQIYYTGVTNVILTGGLTGTLTNGVLTVDGSAATFGTNPPPTGSYVAQSKNGVITWEPVAGIGGTNLGVQVWSTTFGVTNIFTNMGRTTQTWTWAGGTTQVLVKAWGGGGGGSVNYSGGNGGYISGLITVTNGFTLTMQIGGGGATALTENATSSIYSWPGGGFYNTNATGQRGSGGGCTLVYYGTNLLFVAGGGAGSANGGGNAGYPNGANGNVGVQSGEGGTQTRGGVGLLDSVRTSNSPYAGSFLLGGSTGTATNIFQSGGGCGCYGGGASVSLNITGGGGGSSYFNPAFVSYGYGVTGLNSGDINYSANYATSSANALGKHGAVIIITPTP